MQTSRKTSRFALLGALLTLALLLAACGGGGGDEVPAGQCYVAGQPAACTPDVAAPVVHCAASGACS